jgi:uridine phosphorylase
MKKEIKNSELIINEDGSIFHLHLKATEISDTVILVGDPERVSTIANYFDSREVEVQNREFKSVTGLYKGKRLSVISTGIGTDNIDIVVNELDALVNIDFETRKAKKEISKLNIIRIGTSGSIQTDINVDSFVLSTKSIGFDGMLNFYKGRDSVSDLDFEKTFMHDISWDNDLAHPYIVSASEKLIELFNDERTVKGITISANGFYGPQGRVLRLPLKDADLNRKIEKFRYKGLKITNYEMESSAIAGLSALLGHEAITICAIIANRQTGEASPDYNKTMKELIEYTLNKITYLK